MIKVNLDNNETKHTRIFKIYSQDIPLLSNGSLNNELTLTMQSTEITQYTTA